MSAKTANEIAFALALVRAKPVRTRRDKSQVARLESELDRIKETDPGAYWSACRYSVELFERLQRIYSRH